MNPLPEMLNVQIKELYDKSDMQPDQIAEALSVDEHSVKMVLMGSSSKFRNEVKKNPSLFTQDEFDMAKQRITSLVFAENENVAFRAAKFVINENKGRHDLQHVKNLNVNVTLLNDQLVNMKKAIEKGKAKVIDIPAEIEHLAD